MNPWSCLIKAISLLQRLIACLFSVYITEAHCWGFHLSIIDFYQCVGRKKKGHKIHKIWNFTEGFNLLRMAVAGNITSPFSTLKKHFFSKIFSCLCDLQGASVCLLCSSYEAFMQPSRDISFLHVFILQMGPAHRTIIPVCQLVATQKITKALEEEKIQSPVA